MSGWARPCRIGDEAGSGHTERVRQARRRAIALGVSLAATLLIVVPAHGDALDSLILRIDGLEEENRQLRQDVEALKAERGGRVKDDLVAPPPRNSGKSNRVRPC
jgi:hypothetical protein